MSKLQTTAALLVLGNMHKQTTLTGNIIVAVSMVCMFLSFFVGFGAIMLLSIFHPTAMYGDIIVQSLIWGGCMFVISLVLNLFTGYLGGGVAGFIMSLFIMYQYLFGTGHMWLEADAASTVCKVIESQIPESAWRGSRTISPDTIPNHSTPTGSDECDYLQYFHLFRVRNNEAYYSNLLQKSIGYKNEVLNTWPAKYRPAGEIQWAKLVEWCSKHSPDDPLPPYLYLKFGLGGRGSNWLSDWDFIKDGSGGYLVFPESK